MSSSKPSLRALYGKHIFRELLVSKYAEANPDNEQQGLPERPIPDLKDLPTDGGNGEEPFPPTGPICIIGAGAAGLAVAMCLWAAGITDFDILEATDRVGGRAYSYQFPDKTPCTHNYYDMGAMRIPDITGMQPTLQMIDTLGVTKKPYVYTNHSVPNMYFYSNNVPSDKPYTDRIQWLLNKFGFLKAQTEEDIIKDFKAYFADPANYDKYSCRAWMMTDFPKEPDLPRALSFQETETAEMLETSTGLLDQALTEMMIDFGDFQEAGGPWWRVEGNGGNDQTPLTGMSALTDTMRLFVKETTGKDVTLNSPVVAMADLGQTIEVTWGKTVKTRQSKKYNYVFNTTALGCLQRMDLEGLWLPDEIQTGIRTLAYDRATKVAIKFKSQWWLNCDITSPGEGLPPGGVSSTDMPISNVVYPSWEDGDSSASVLMVSYSWAQDATRMGSMVPDYTHVKPTIDDPILTLCLENLVKLFRGRRNAPNLDFLRDQWITHHAWAWSHDPYTGGAFALFGPGQFSNVYPAVNTPQCNGKLYICGEATSVHHAWISGALDSAYVSVLQFAHIKFPVAAAKLKASWLGGGEGNHPAEADETLLWWASKLGPGAGKDVKKQ